MTWYSEGENTREVLLNYIQSISNSSFEMSKKRQPTQSEYVYRWEKPRTVFSRGPNRPGFERSWQPLFCACSSLIVYLKCLEFFPTIINYFLKFWQWSEEKYILVKKFSLAALRSVVSPIRVRLQDIDLVKVGSGLKVFRLLSFLKVRKLLTIHHSWYYSLL